MRNFAAILAAVVAASGVVACSDPVAPAASPNPAPTVTGPAPSARGSTGLTTIYNVQIQSEPFAINVYFKYAGTGTPNFTASITVPGYAYYQTVAAKNMNNGYWLGRLENMRAGTEFNLKISDGDKSWTGTAKTYRRRLIVDIDKIHVQFDGDSGPGCGELIFKAEISPGYGFKDTWWSKWHDLCTGDDLVLSDAEGRRVVDDWTTPHAYIYHKSFESDDCWAWESWCGQFGWAAQELIYDVSGGAKSYTFQISSADVSYPKVIWYGTVKTTFVP